MHYPTEKLSSSNYVAYFRLLFYRDCEKKSVNKILL